MITSSVRKFGDSSLAPLRQFTLSPSFIPFLSLLLLLLILVVLLLLSGQYEAQGTDNQEGEASQTL